MGLAIGGVIANWFGVLIVYMCSLEDQIYGSILPIACISALISTIGILFAGENKKIASILIIISSIIFVPLGLIGIFGARQITNLANEKTLEERRNS